MVKVNTLFRKGYLLAGVMMAANMFVVNEVKASAKGPNTGKTEEKKEILDTFDLSQNEKNTNDLNIIERGKSDPKKQSSLDKFLSCENYFNLFGTLALSGANNYFKWWDYNAGGYLSLRIGCLGWRTKKFFDIVQVGINLNLGRGAFWAILHIINFMQFMQNLKQKKGTEENNEVINEDDVINKNGSNAGIWVSFLFKDILKGFISAPLTFHISNFSISISIDAIIWIGIAKKIFKNEQVQPGERQGEEALRDIDIKA